MGKGTETRTGKGKGKGKKGAWPGAWGKGGKGAYSCEDDWSQGYSGYSFDTPLFLNSLAQEAAGEWRMVKSKKSSVGTITGPPQDTIPTEFGSWVAATEGWATGRSPGHSTGGSPEEWSSPFRAPGSPYYQSETGDREVLTLTIERGDKQFDTPLHSVSWKDESHPQWVRIRTVMDSGAADSVALTTLAPQVTIDESRIQTRPMLRVS